MNDGQPGDFTERNDFWARDHAELAAAQKAWDDAHQAMAGFKSEMRAMFGGAPPTNYDQWEHWTHRLVNFMCGGVLDSPRPMSALNEFAGEGPSEMGEGAGVAAVPSSDRPSPVEERQEPGSPVADPPEGGSPLTAGELRDKLTAEMLSGPGAQTPNVDAALAKQADDALAAMSGVALGIDPGMDPGTPHVENAAIQPGDHTSFDVPTTEAEVTETLPQPEHDPAAQS